MNLERLVRAVGDFSRPFFVVLKLARAMSYIVVRIPTFSVLSFALNFTRLNIIIIYNINKQICASELQFAVGPIHILNKRSDFVR